MYSLSQLKRSGLGTRELVQFFCTCIRPITEYVCPVFHDYRIHTEGTHMHQHNMCLINMATRESTWSQHALRTNTDTYMGITVHLPS